MTHDHRLTRRTALTTLAGTTLSAFAGCLNQSPAEQPTDNTPSGSPNANLSTEITDEGQLVVNLAEDLDVDQVNLIQPDGELYGKRDVATGVSQVTYDLGTSYQPGDYTIIALQGDTTTAETTLEIQPTLQITNVGLYRNYPDKPWDEIYGESETNRTKNSEAFVAVSNEGTGPDTAVEMTFTGDVPNPLANPDGSGIYKTSNVTIPAGETVDIFSSSYPFGTKTSDGMGCSIEGNSGEFTISIQTSVGSDVISRSFSVHYQGSEEMTDCTIGISEN